MTQAFCELSFHVPNLASVSVALTLSLLVCVCAGMHLCMCVCMCVLWLGESAITEDQSPLIFRKTS